MDCNTPSVSVLMPVYNAERYLIDAVASIVEQTVQDWELVCVNDGSTDQSAAMLDWFASQDSRIRVLHQENQGLVGALNVGIAASRAAFIMRMDNDDIALPERMFQQLSFMRRNPQCVVVGGGILQMDSDAAPLGLSHNASQHSQIVHDLMHRRTGHFHPTTMIRRQALEQVTGYYRPEFEWVEDHDLWLRLSEIGELANLPDVVLCYRMHASSICWQRSNQQRELMNRLLKQAYETRGLDVPPGVILDETTQRSAAGPGKWARISAKGGFHATAWKHLSELNRSQANWTYKARMNIEVMSRIMRNRLKRERSSRMKTEVPTFGGWHRAWQAYSGNKQAA